MQASRGARSPPWIVHSITTEEPLAMSFGLLGAGCPTVAR